MNHFSGQNVRFREAEENVGAFHRFGKGCNIFAIRCEKFLLRCQVLAGFADDAFAVHHDDVFFFHAQRQIKLGAGDGCGSCAVYDELDFIDVLSGNVESVDKGRAADDCRSVLVVVHHGNVQGGF